MKDLKDRDNIEVLIIDGESTDNTGKVIKELTKKYKQVRSYQNKNRIQASALNIGINESSGEYLIRLDAHSEYSSEYIKRCIEILEKSSENIANVGGSITTKPGSDTSVAKAISFILSEKLGVGNSAFRTEEILEEKLVETVPFGCFRRSALEEVGLFDENLVRGEDLELNRRLINSGRKILISPLIKSVYYSRPDLLSFIKQAFVNGFYVLFSSKPSKKGLSRKAFHQLRHYLPLFFIFYLFIASIVLITNYSNSLTTIEIVFLSLLLVYLCIGVFLGIRLSFKEKGLIYLILTPLVLTILHTSYGLGSLLGLVSNLFRNRKEV